MINDRSQIRRQAIAAESAGLAVANNLLGYKKIIKNAAVSDDIHDLILHLFNMPELKTSG